jgi:hypothetical protein
MKNTTWNILTIVVLIGTCLMGSMVVQIYSNPATAFNPFQPATMPATVVIPSATPTLQSLPPTWTPTPLLQSQDTGLLPSSTPVPTLAAYRPSPTITVSPTLTEIASPVPLITNTPGVYDCTLTNQLPPNGSNFAPGSEFFATWTIENNGWYSLDSDNVDYRYLNGTHLQKLKDAYDLPQTLMRSGSINLVVPMVAPSAPGIYAATWAVVSGKQVICSWTIQVNVSVTVGTPPA